MSLQEFSRTPSIGLRAQQLSNSLFFGPPRSSRYLTSLPFGSNFSILGAGVYYIEDRDTIVAFVEAGIFIKEGERIPLIELSNGREALGTLYGDNAREWSDCIAIGIIPPEVQLAPGDFIGVSSSNSTQFYLNQGTCGTPVTWGNNHRGFLTAGHVANQINYNVEDINGNYIGVVAGVWDSAQSQTGADIAVVELSNANIVLNHSGFQGPQKITQGPANIDLYLPGGTSTAQVLGNASWLNFPSTKGTYLDLYLTGTSITQGGDSGSAVTITGTNDLIGHVIAGTGTLMSVIQDAQYQLSVIKTAPLFNSITL
jgi:hypothetical protein